MAKIFIGNIRGPIGPKGDNTPIKGVDYWTEEDKEEIHNDTAKMVDEANADLDTRVASVENELHPPKSYTYKFNETLDVGDGCSWSSDVPIARYNGVEYYGMKIYYDSGLEYFELYEGNDDDSNIECLYEAEWCNGEPATIEFLAELPDDVKAVVDTNAILISQSGGSLSDRVTALEAKIAELEANAVKVN